MWHELAIAFCLLLVLEGIMPFAAPRKWRSMIQAVAQADDRTLRLVGLGSMVSGLLLLMWIN